jgi:hypothetical protein
MGGVVSVMSVETVEVVTEVLVVTECCAVVLGVDWVVVIGAVPAVWVVGDASGAEVTLSGEEVPLHAAATITMASTSRENRITLSPQVQSSTLWMRRSRGQRRFPIAIGD